MTRHIKYIDMINITFPDGGVKQFEAGITPLQIAESISPRLAQEVLAATVNDAEWDISRPINEDASITVQDNGRGIPVDMHAKLHKSALEVVMTVLHAGGKFDKGSYKVSGGLHGVGVSCVNALSTRMKSQVFRDGKIYQQEYEKGKPLYPVKVVGETDLRGTRQQFWPDPTVFTTTHYQWDIIARRMRELAFLNAGIRITLRDMRPNEEGKTREEVFHAKDGLKEFVRYVDRHRTHLFDDVIYLKTEKQGIPIEVAVMYNTDYSENIQIGRASCIERV